MDKYELSETALDVLASVLADLEVQELEDENGSCNHGEEAA